MSDTPTHKYIVRILIDVKRIDNQMLTDNENSMVQEMHKAAETAVAEIMNKHGQKQLKHFGKKTIIY